MRMILYLAVLLTMASCIPYTFAPNIEGTKLTKAKRFKGNLPKQEALIFKDPGEKYEFQQFLAKRLNFKRGGSILNAPFNLNDKTYYLSYYERERSTRTFNLWPILFDFMLEANDVEPVLEESYTSRWGTWYAILTVTDENGQDCLSSEYENRLEVATYLRLLHADYFTPMNALGTTEN